MKFSRRICVQACAAALLTTRHGRAENTSVHIGGARLDVAYPGGPLDLPREALAAWIDRAARAVTTYFGRFPVKSAHIEISVAEGRRGVSRGMSFGEGGALCRISVGQHATVADLRNDWSLTHEMVHFGFPSVPRRHHWMEEGSATYIEPIARAQTGELSAKKVWGDVVRDMHQGLPEEGDRGLDNTHTWGRTYWGGALFWLMADVGIRQKTSNKKGVEHAFRAINHAGGNITADWPVERVLQVGGAATDGVTLRTLYEEMANNPVPVDLPALWNRLGIVRRGEEVEFDEKAPLAAIRGAILRA